MRSPAFDATVAVAVAALLLLTAPTVSANTQYPAFPARRILNLDGLWQFAYLGPSAGDPVTLVPTSVVTNGAMIVPAAFDAQPGMYGVRGTAVYRHTFSTTPGATAKLFFGACGFYCAVWVNGIRVADHGIGFSPFWVGGLPASTASTTLVEVVVDKRFNTSRAYLHDASDRYDFYQVGWATRSWSLASTEFVVSAAGRAR